jgi:hypothetical protein
MIDDMSWRVRLDIASRFGCGAGIVSESAPDDASGGYLYIPEDDSLEHPSRIVTIADFAAASEAEARDASAAIIERVQANFLVEGATVAVFDRLADDPSRAYYDVAVADARKIGAIFALDLQVYAVSLQTTADALPTDADIAAMRATVLTTESAV